MAASGTTTLPSAVVRIDRSAENPNSGVAARGRGELTGELDADHGLRRWGVSLRARRHAAGDRPCPAEPGRMASSLALPPHRGVPLRGRRPEATVRGSR